MSIRDTGGFKDIIRRSSGKTSTIPHHDHDASDVSGTFNFVRALSAIISGDIEIVGDVVISGTTRLNSQLFIHNILQHINLVETDAGDYPNMVFILDINGGVGRLFWADQNLPGGPLTFVEGLEVYQDGRVKVKVNSFGVTEGTAALPAIISNAAPTDGQYHAAGLWGFSIAGLAVGGFTADGLNTFGGGVPIGALFPYVGTTAPTGYLLCNGAAVSRTTYAKLFALAGTAFGAGDGSTTFNLPNLGDRFPIGVGSNARGVTGGTYNHLHSQPTHVHDLGSHFHGNSGNTGTVSSDHGHGFNVNSGFMSAVVGVASPGAQNAGDHVHNVAGNTGGISANHFHGYGTNTGGPSANSGAQGNENTGTANPPFQAFNWIVRSQA